MNTTQQEAERSVIGAALIEAGTIRSILEHVTPDDFYDVTLGNVFGLIIEMAGAGKGTDALTVASTAKDRKITGVTPASLFELVEGTPTAANASFYAQIVAEAASKRRLWAAGTRMAQAASSDVSAADAMNIARDAWSGVSSPVSNGLDAPTLGTLLEGEDNYDWIIPNLMERRDRLVLTGGEGAGKSTFVRQIAIASAAGIHPLTFEPMTPLRVLVVDAENSEKQWRRKAAGLANQAARHGTVDPRETVRISCVSRLDITTERDLSAVHALIDAHKPDLVAIGPLYKLVPRAITNDDDAAPLIDALDSLRARGVALVMEAHAGHGQSGSGVRDLRPRGSAALLGWPEFGMGLQVDRDNPRRANLVRWRGDRDERAWPDQIERGSKTGWPWADADGFATAQKYDRATQEF